MLDKHTARHYLSRWASLRIQDRDGGVGWNRRSTLGRVADEGLTGAAIKTTARYTQDDEVGAVEFVTVEKVIRFMDEQTKATVYADYGLLDGVRGAREVRCKKIGISRTAYANALLVAESMVIAAIGLGTCRQGGGV